jgi:hypothetical protein
MPAADFCQCRLGVEDELTRDLMGDAQRLGVDAPKQNIVHDLDERGHARNFCLGMRQERHADAAPIGTAWPFRQKACALQSPNFRRHMRRGQGDVFR